MCEPWGKLVTTIAGNWGEDKSRKTTSLQNSHKEHKEHKDFFSVIFVFFVIFVAIFYLIGSNLAWKKRRYSGS